MTEPFRPDAAGRPRRIPYIATLSLLALAVIWLAGGLHRVPPADKRTVVRTSLFSAPTTLSPGWHLSPRLITRARTYPAAPVRVHVRLASGSPESAVFRSREGVHMLAAGTLLLRSDATRPDRLAASLPAGWEGDAEVVEQALEEPLSRYAAASGFADLVQAATGIAEPLAQALAEMGLVVEEPSSLRFYPSMRPPAASTSSQVPAKSWSESRRVLIIGLDGADWDIIDPLMRQGRMPHIKRLVETGARARLKTITPVLSPIIWTSIATGVGPDRHGILDFLATSVTTGNQIPVTSNMRRVKALWNILSESGRSSGVIAWWATWPAEQVNGFIISDRVSYQLFSYPGAGESLRRRTYPEALGLVIQPLVVAPAQVSDAEVARFLPPQAAGAPDAAELVRKLKTIIASSRTYLGIGLDLLSAYDPDLKAIYFEGTDTVAHNFMRYRPPAMSGVTQAELAAYGGVVDRYYEYQDEVLGKVLDLAGEDTVIILCSDHGFRTGSNRPASDPRIEMGGAADWHRKFGILTLTGPGIRRGVTLQDASVLDITPTVLALMGLPVAQDMAGRVLSDALDSPERTQTIATYETGSGPGGAGDAEPLDSALDEEIIARLTALGYVGQEGSNALNNTGITLLDRGRYSEAAEVFRQAVQQEPRFLQARINLGRAQMLMKEYDSAIETFQAALRADPSQAEVHTLLGNIFMERQEARDAELHFRKSLELNSNDTNALNSLGLLYEKTGRDEEAIAHYRKVIAVDPDYAEAYNNIGLIHRKGGDARQAIARFEQAIQADPDFAGSYNNMGLAYQDLGLLDEARRAFEAGLKVDAENAVILNNLGTVDLAREDLAVAKERFEQAIRADPEYPSAYNNLGAVLGMLGRQEESFEQYLKAVELDPAYTDARFNLARHLLTQNKTHEAVEMLEKLLAMDPRYGKALLQLGIVLARQGDMEGAARRAGMAAKEMPSSPDPHNLLAEIYLRLGKREEARRELSTSLGINGAQPNVRQMLEKLDAGGG